MISVYSLAQLLFVGAILFYFQSTLLGAIITLLVNTFLRAKIKRFKMGRMSFFPFSISDFEITVRGGSKKSPELTVRWKKFYISLDISKIADPFLDLLQVLPHDPEKHSSQDHARGKMISFCFEDMYAGSTEFNWDLFLAASSAYGGATAPTDGSPDVFAGDPPPTSNGLIIKKVVQRVLLYIDIRIDRKVDFDFLFPWDECSIIGYANKMVVTFPRPPAEKTTNIIVQIIFKHGDVRIKQTEEEAAYFMAENVGAKVDFFIPAGMMDCTGFVWKSDNPQQPNEVWVTIAPFLELYRRFGLSEDKGIEVKLTRDLITNGKMGILGECEFLTVHVRDYRISEEVVFDLWGVAGGLKTHMLTIENERLWCGKLVVQDDLADLKDAEQLLEDNKKLGGKVSQQDVLKLQRNVERLYKMMMKKNPGQRRLKRGPHKDKTMSLTMDKLIVRMNNDPEAATKIEGVWFKKAQRVNSTGSFIDDDFIDIGIEALILQRADGWILDWLFVALDALAKVPSSNFSHRKNSNMTFDIKKIVFSTQPSSFSYNPPSPDSVPLHPDAAGEFKTQEELDKHRSFVQSLQLSAMSAVPIDESRWLSLTITNMFVTKVRKFDNLDSSYDLKMGEMQIETILPTGELEFQYDLSVGEHEESEAVTATGDGVSVAKIGKDDLGLDLIDTVDADGDAVSDAGTDVDAVSDAPVQRFGKNRGHAHQASFSDMKFDDLYVPRQHYDHADANDNPLLVQKKDPGGRYGLHLPSEEHHTGVHLDGHVEGIASNSATPTPTTADVAATAAKDSAHSSRQTMTGTRWTLPAFTAKFQMGEKVIVKSVGFQALKIEFSNSLPSGGDEEQFEEAAAKLMTDLAGGNIAPAVPLTYHLFVEAKGANIVWGEEGKKLIQADIEKLTVRASAAGAIKALCAFDIIKRGAGKLGARMSFMKNNARLIDAAVQWTESGNYEVIAAFRFNIDTTKSTPPSGSGGFQLHLPTVEIEVPVDMPVGYHLCMRRLHMEQMALLKQKMDDREVDKLHRERRNLKKQERIIPKTYRKFSWQSSGKDNLAFAAPRKLGSGSGKSAFAADDDDNKDASDRPDFDFREYIVDRTDKTIHVLLSNASVVSHGGEMQCSLHRCTVSLNCFPENNLLRMNELQLRTCKRPLSPDDMYFKVRQECDFAATTGEVPREKSVLEASIQSLHMNLSSRMELNLVSDVLSNQSAVFAAASKPPPPRKLAKLLADAGRVAVFYDDSDSMHASFAGDPLSEEVHHPAADSSTDKRDGENDLAGKLALEAAAKAEPSCKFLKVAKVEVLFDVHYKDEYLSSFASVEFDAIDLALDSTASPADVQDEITTLDVGKAPLPTSKPKMARNSSVGASNCRNGAVTGEDSGVDTPLTPYTQYVLKQCLSPATETDSAQSQPEVEKDVELHTYTGVSGGYLNMHISSFRVDVKHLGDKPFLEVENFGFYGSVYSASVADPRILNEESTVGLSDTVPIFNPEVFDDLEAIASHFFTSSQQSQSSAATVATSLFKPPARRSSLRRLRSRKASVASIANINSALDNINHGFAEPLFARVSKSTGAGKVYLDLVLKGSTIEVHHHPATADCLGAVGAVVDCVLPVNRDTSPLLPGWDLLRYLCHGCFSFQFDQLFINSHATDYLGHQVLLRLNAATTEFYLDRNSVEFATKDIVVDAEMANPNSVQQKSGPRICHQQWTKLCAIPGVVFSLRHAREAPPAQFTTTICSSYQDMQQLKRKAAAAAQSHDSTAKHDHVLDELTGSSNSSAVDGSDDRYTHHDVYLKPAVVIYSNKNSDSLADLARYLNDEEVDDEDEEADLEAMTAGAGSPNFVSLGLESSIKYVNNDKFHHFRSKKNSARWDIELRLADTDETPVWIFLRIEQLLRIIDALQGGEKKEEANKTRSFRDDGDEYGNKETEERRRRLSVDADKVHTLVLDKASDYNKGVKRPPSTVSIGALINQLQVQVVLNKIMCSTWPSTSDLGGIVIIQDRSDIQLRMLRVVPESVQQQRAALLGGLEKNSATDLRESRYDEDDADDAAAAAMMEEEDQPLQIDHFFCETAFMEVYVRNWQLGSDDDIAVSRARTASTLVAQASQQYSSANIGSADCGKRKAVGEPDNAVHIQTLFEPIYRLAHATTLVITLSDLGEVAIADQQRFVPSSILLNRQEKQFRAESKPLGYGRNKVAEKHTEAAAASTAAVTAAVSNSGGKTAPKSKLRKQLINFGTLDYLKQDEEEQAATTATAAASLAFSISPDLSKGHTHFMIGKEFRDYLMRLKAAAVVASPQQQQHQQLPSRRRRSVLRLHLQMKSRIEAVAARSSDATAATLQRRRSSIMSIASAAASEDADSQLHQQQQHRVKGVHYKYYVDSDGSRHVHVMDSEQQRKAAAESQQRKGKVARKRMVSAIQKVAKVQLLQSRFKRRDNTRIGYIAAVQAFEKNHAAFKPPRSALPSTNNALTADFLTRAHSNCGSDNNSSSSISGREKKKEDSSFGDNIWGVRVIDCRFLCTLNIRDTLTAYVAHSMELAKQLKHEEPATTTATTTAAAATTVSTTAASQHGQRTKSEPFPAAPATRKKVGDKAGVHDFLLRSPSLSQHAANNLLLLSEASPGKHAGTGSSDAATAATAAGRKRPPAGKAGDLSLVRPDMAPINVTAGAVAVSGSGSKGFSTSSDSSEAAEILRLLSPRQLQHGATASPHNVRQRQPELVQKGKSRDYQENLHGSKQMLKRAYQKGGRGLIHEHSQVLSIDDDLLGEDAEQHTAAAGGATANGSSGNGFRRVPSIVPLAHEGSINFPEATASAASSAAVAVEATPRSLELQRRSKLRDFEYFFRVELIDPQLNFLDTKTHSSLLIVSESSVVEGRRFKYAALPPLHDRVNTVSAGAGSSYSSSSGGRLKRVVGEPKRQQDVRLKMEKVEAYTVCTLLTEGKSQQQQQQQQQDHEADMIHWRHLPSTITRAKDVQEKFVNGAGELGAGISSTSFAQHSDREVEQSPSCVRAIKDFTIRALYTFWTDVTVGEARRMALRHAKEDLVATFRLELPEIQVETVSWQFNVVISALRNVLLAPPPSTANSSSNSSSSGKTTAAKEESNGAVSATAATAEGKEKSSKYVEVARSKELLEQHPEVRGVWKEPLDANRNHCREEIKMLMDDLIKRNLFPMDKHSPRTRFVETYIGRCTWVLRAASSASTSAFMADAQALKQQSAQSLQQVREQMKNVEQLKIEWTGIYATMEFAEDKSTSTVFEVQRMWARDMDPGKDALSLLTDAERQGMGNNNNSSSKVSTALSVHGNKQETTVLMPELRHNIEHCTCCGCDFVLEENHSSACSFHADEDGSMGEFREAVSAAVDGTKQPHSVSYWSCCGASFEFAPGCRQRPHMSKDIMIRITADSAPPARVENIDVNVLTHCDISVFPTTEYKLHVRLTKSMSEVLHEFFKLEPAADAAAANTAAATADAAADTDAITAAAAAASASSPRSDLTMDDESVVSGITNASTSANKKKRLSAKSIRKLFGIKSIAASSAQQQHEVVTMEYADAQRRANISSSNYNSSRVQAVASADAEASDAAVAARGEKQEVLYLKFFRVSGLCIEVSTAGFLMNIPNFRAEMDAYHNNHGNVVLAKDLIRDIETHWIRTVFMNTASSTFHGVYDRIRNAVAFQPHDAAGAAQSHHDSDWEQHAETKETKRQQLLGLGARPVQHLNNRHSRGLSSSVHSAPSSSPQQQYTTQFSPMKGPQQQQQQRPPLASKTAPGSLNSQGAADSPQQQQYQQQQSRSRVTFSDHGPHN